MRHDPCRAAGLAPGDIADRADHHRAADQHPQVHRLGKDQRPQSRGPDQLQQHHRLRHRQGRGGGMPASSRNARRWQRPPLPPAPRIASGWGTPVQPSGASLIRRSATSSPPPPAPAPARPAAWRPDRTAERDRAHSCDRCPGPSARSPAQNDHRPKSATAMAKASAATRCAPISGPRPM